jgi:hypothetical protein
MQGQIVPTIKFLFFKKETEPSDGRAACRGKLFLHGAEVIAAGRRCAVENEMSCPRRCCFQYNWPAVSLVFAQNTA